MKIFVAAVLAVVVGGVYAADAVVEEVRPNVETVRTQLQAASTSIFNKGDVLSVLKVTTSKEEAAAFVKTFQDSPKTSHKMKGFRGLAVAENSKVAGGFLVISVWENEEALNAYIQSKGFGEDHEKSGSIKSAQMEPPARYIVKDK